MTVLDLIERSSARLTEAGVSFGHGTGNAFDEAAWLVLWRLGHALDTLDEVAALPVPAADQAAVEALIGQRIASRKPAAYLTNEAWLQGVAFYVDQRVIVPRSLIAELLVDGTLDYWLPTDGRKALDLCTGGASLAILAAMAWPELAVDALDISADALAVARLNLERHGLTDRVRLLQGDGLAGARGPYDLILCNPPYVNSASMAALPAEYQAEPALAMAGGVDGMDFVRRLVRDAPAYLLPDAALVLEIGNERAFFESAFPALAAVWLETSAGEDQVCVLTRAALATDAARGTDRDPTTPPS